MTTLKELEVRIAALEARKEPEMRAVRDGAFQDNAATFVLSDPSYTTYGDTNGKSFSLRLIVYALAKKAGLKIIYHFPTGEKVEYK